MHDTRAPIWQKRIASYIADAARRHRADEAKVRGRSRVVSACHARFEVMRRLRADGLSTLDIGHALGRDHSTIVHGLTVPAPGLWFGFGAAA